MKKAKRILAFLLAAIMVMAMGTTAFAEEGAVPSESDSSSITVSGLKDGDVVEAWQIIKANYNDYGFVEYQWAVDFPSSDAEGGYKKDTPVEFETKTTGEGENAETTIKGLTSENITIYANTLYKGATEATNWKAVAMPETYKGQATAVAAEGAETATATLNELPVGTFLILVGSTDGAVVYNPMVASIYYTVSGSDNTMSSEGVSAGDNWELETTNAYAKSSEPTISKVIVEGDSEKKGNDVSFGDTVNFRVTATIPSYSEDYENITYTITDELSEGLVLEELTKICLGVIGEDGVMTETEIASVFEGHTNPYEVKSPEAGDSWDYKIVFSDSFIRANAGKTIIIEYSAVLTGYDEEGGQLANTNAVPNTNKVTLEYSNDPTDSTETKTKDDKTYTYSFELDGNVLGKFKKEKYEKWDEETYELIKTNDGTYKENLVATKNYHKQVVDSEEKNLGLSGAEFTLTEVVGEGETARTWTAKTDDSGYMNFVGLDAGNYTLQETVAPTGYSINNEVIKVKIKAEYETDGRLKFWNVTVGEGDDAVTNSYTLDYGTVTEITSTTLPTVMIKSEGGVDGATVIKNTKLSNLPSTGGIGTTIFTIGGVILMVGAAGIFFLSRRKKNA